ncbi:MAG: 4-hydroxythreonine-4-phosphate dehydrogenase PdxA [Verrucomicrobiota bacterium JB022]|nr:4-hydroxythreonine-4-phosphate dehydrogenase PdxA [Verrucomicrobiota bacterium JB022]
MSKPLALTCGDPAGVGPEIIQSWLAELPADQRDDIVVLGPADWLSDLPVAGEAVGPEDFALTPGEPNRDGAVVAWQAMKVAAQGCIDGRFRGVVTGPIAKGLLQSIGYPHPGQTEFFAAAWGGEPSMAFVGERLRLVLATWHDPIMQVGQLLHDNPGLLTRAVERADWLARGYGVEQPRIAVCGLNPHAGESGMLGREEVDWIDPRLDELRNRFPGLSRTLPGDTVFFRALRDEFDVVVALYHDQGLGPLKTLEFDTAVNVTLGLPYVRTSPDHGTAFHLAGKGLASTRSFAHAVEVARRLTR